MIWTLINSLESQTMFSTLDKFRGQYFLVYLSPFVWAEFTCVTLTYSGRLLLSSSNAETFTLFVTYEIKRIPGSR